jgi:hypothetical protein
MASRLKVQGGSHRHEHLSMVGPRPNSGGSGMRGGVGARERSASSIRRTFNAERPDIRLRKVAEQLVQRFGRLGQTQPPHQGATGLRVERCSQIEPGKAPLSQRYALSVPPRPPRGGRPSRRPALPHENSLTWRAGGVSTRIPGRSASHQHPAGLTYRCGHRHIESRHQDRHGGSA